MGGPVWAVLYGRSCMGGPVWAVLRGRPSLGSEITWPKEGRPRRTAHTGGSLIAIETLLHSTSIDPLASYAKTENSYPHLRSGIQHAGAAGSDSRWATRG